ncbi:MAG: hypothetical protein LUG91_03825 [Ruminococcus sp.]|nr:hypothetical protein [Ruminococcus sp.]
MKNRRISSLISAVAFVSAITATVSTSAMAANDTLIYGTMDIPYAEFYAAEFGSSANAYEVDAVSSATTARWLKNGEGELFEGTYNEANDDGTGTILGVTYPVAITQADLDALGDANYNFTALDETPTAYKTVTVTDGSAAFSAVVDTDGEETLNTTVSLSTSTPWGDYLLETADSVSDLAIYGAYVVTADGNTYMFRHEQNIWRGEFAWSSGITTTEPHGNSLDWEDYESLMGSTITELVVINTSGYLRVSTNTYVPVKFENTITVTDAAAGTGTTDFTMEGFPDSYTPSGSVADGFSVTATTNGGTISYENALAGSYTLTLSDTSGVYADATATFALTTDTMPATYDDSTLSLAAAEDADESDFENFLANLSTVSVNGVSYTASGHGATSIFVDGVLDLSVTSGGEAIFSGSADDTYEIEVAASGYTQTLIFTIDGTGALLSDITSGTSDTDETDGTDDTSDTDDTDTTDEATDSSGSSTTSSNSGTSSSTKTSSPHTGDTGVAAVASVTAMIALLAAAVSKKRK